MIAPPASLCPGADLAECVALLARPLVFVHGLFDGVTPAQREQLDAAGRLGSTLAIGLLSDRAAGIAGLEPRHDEQARAWALHGMRSVAITVLCDEPVPLQLATWLRPQLWVWLDGGPIAPEAAAVLSRCHGRALCLPEIGWTASDQRLLRPRHAA
jgi:bifunctional ADP-heptose synthase (sugar kinase/adenylyltransferase)